MARPIPVVPPMTTAERPVRLRGANGTLVLFCTGAKALSLICVYYGVTEEAAEKIMVDVKTLTSGAKAQRIFESCGTTEVVP